MQFQFLHHGEKRDSGNGDAQTKEVVSQKVEIRPQQRFHRSHNKDVDEIKRLVVG